MFIYCIWTFSQLTIITLILFLQLPSTLLSFDVLINVCLVPTLFGGSNTSIIY